MGMFSEKQKVEKIIFFSSTPWIPIDYKNTFAYTIENIYTPLIYTCNIKS